MRLLRRNAASSTRLSLHLPLRNASSSTLAYLAQYARHTNYGLLLELKSAKTTSQGASSEPSAVPPLRPHLTTRMIVLGTAATKASGTTPLMQVDLAARLTAPVTRTVGMVLVVTMLTDARGGDLLTDPPLLTIPRHPLLGHCRLALLSHLHQPPRPQCQQLWRPLTIKRRPTMMVIA